MENRESCYHSLSDFVDYSDFQVNEVQIDLSPNLSPTRREALIFSPMGVRSDDFGLNT
jgi:hypothetical protein